MLFEVFETDTIRRKKMFLETGVFFQYDSFYANLNLILILLANKT